MRLKIQEMVQSLLEAELTEFLGRQRYERRSAADAQVGSRNGHGKRRRVSLSCGTITVRRPRARDLDERFESRVLPLFVRRTEEVADLIPDLYLHGLAAGDFDLALRGLLGEKAPLSASTVVRLKDKWKGELEQWNSRPLDDLEPVYMWVDGVYVKAGLDKTKAAVLVVLVGLADGRKVFVALQAGHRESTDSWSEVLRDLRDRGLRCPKLVIGDGHLGIWGGLANVFPEANEQRCWNHRFMNILDKVPKKHQVEAKRRLRAIPYAESLMEAEAAKSEFQQWAQQEGFPAAGTLLDKDWERMVTFYQFPKEHWRHLRTTNPIESPFAALRLRTDAAKRFKRVDNAVAVICKMLLLAERRFRRLCAPEKAMEVYLGAEFVDGQRVLVMSQREAA